MCFPVSRPMPTMSEFFSPSGFTVPGCTILLSLPSPKPPHLTEDSRSCDVLSRRGGVEMVGGGRKERGRLLVANDFVCQKKQREVFPTHTHAAESCVSW